MTTDELVRKVIALGNEVPERCEAWFAINRLVHFLWDHPNACDSPETAALRDFVARGMATQSSIDDILWGRGEVPRAPGAPKKVPAGKGGKGPGKARPKKARRNRSI